MERSININIPDEKIREFCRKWSVTEFYLFGSVLRKTDLISRRGIERSRNLNRRREIPENAELIYAA